MEHLKDTEKFGVGYKEGDELEGFSEELLSWIERRIYNKISKRVNFLLTRVNGQKLEIIADGNSDEDEDGNWKIIISSGNLIVQKRISGTWITSETYHG